LNEKYSAVELLDQLKPENHSKSATDGNLQQDHNPQSQHSTWLSAWRFGVSTTR